MRDSHRKVAGPGRLLRRSFVFACLAPLLLCSQSKASTTILAFTQAPVIPPNPTPVSLTNNGAGGNIAGSETISVTNLPVAIGTLNGMGQFPTLAAFLTLTAHNTGPATLTGTDASEPFAGSFTITAGMGGTGFNFLSGTFTDRVHGAVGGGSLVLSAAQPPAPNMIHFTSDVVGMPLGLPKSVSLSFANLTPLLGFTGTSGTTGSVGVPGTTKMSVTGTFGAGITTIPEPSSFLIAGIGGLGLIGYGLRRRRTPGV
jgi:hypothetical protein